MGTEYNIQNITVDCLLEMIKKQNTAYRAGTPIVTDAVYDAEIEKLKELDPENEWFKHVEPSPVSTSRKRKLPLPMKSLNKVKDINELKKWFSSLGLHADTELILMPKFDGLSLLHNEQTGEAWSRGGAENEGQDCTAHCIAANIVSDTRYLFTYGEFVITRENWRQNFEGKRSEYTGDIYKSPRNTAAGFLNRDEPCKEIAHASFFRYGMDNSTLNSFETFGEAITAICMDYQQPHLHKKVKTKDVTEEMLLSLFKEWSVMYPIDGIVVYINKLSIWNSIGRHQTTGNPLYAIAYKHPDFTESFETTVKGITWKASKSGALKPVVNIEMVNTGDCNMENPTGYNAGWINDHEIAKGAKILVTRSGGVIPKIIETLQPATTEEQERLWDELAECPHCGFPTSWNSNGIELCCTSPLCQGMQLAKIVFFYTQCGAENMGEETIAKIQNIGKTTVHDFLTVTAKELLGIDGFGDGIASIVLENNKKLLEGIELPTLMQASDCFTGIGKVKAQKILDKLSESDDYDKFFRMEYTPPQKGDKVYANASKTFQSFYDGVIPFYHFVKASGLTFLAPKEDEVNKDGTCASMKVCVSGFRDAELEAFIKHEGGETCSSVSKKTTHLVVKDKTATSSKIIKAESLGVAILNIDEFKELVKYSS